MTPSFPHRIDSLIQAMNDIVLPAIDSEQSLAREQAQLVMAHLQLLKLQLPRAAEFDQQEYAAAAALAQQLLELGARQSALSEARQGLQSALNTQAPAGDAQARIRTLNGALETLVRAIRASGERQTIEAMTAAVMAHAQQQSLRNRIWFASNGFDAARDQLPSVDQMFAELR